RVSDQALADVRKFIQELYPDDLPAEPQQYTMGKRSQDAHEAIRPSYVAYTPESVKEHLTRDQFRLYSIIWERFVSSQMLPALAKSLTVDITVGDALFRATASKVVKKGFHHVLKLLGTKSTAQTIPDLKPLEELSFVQFHHDEHFTSGPSRYTDASIVKALEEKGIGRPSTYAPIISVLLDRYYVVRKNRQLIPTTLGRTICDLLLNAFPDILDVNFTAEMENRLDKVEEEKEAWAGMIRDFYSPFKHKVDHVMETLEKITVKGLEDKTDYICEKCGKPMVKKLGRFGFFLACSGFPECMNTKSLPLADCPKPGCDGKIVARKKQGGRGKEFYGCTNYPACDFITHHKPTSLNCPKCGWFLVEKEDKKKGNHKVCINPSCDFLHFEAEEEPAADD
ncbi:MAG: type I DNA topoisomerase, partial [Spirochaetales bacterium]